MQLKIVHNTWIKSRPVPAFQLDDTEKEFFYADTVFSVSAISPDIERGHLKVTLGKDATTGKQLTYDGRNTFYIYEPHTLASVPTKISGSGIALIKYFEGLSLTAYFCPAQIPTVGYGSTGPHVYTGMTITEAQAEELLKRDLERFEKGVRRLVKVPLEQHSFDALVSFSFNAGLGALESSTLLRKLNAGDRQGAAGEFGKWVKGGNGVLQGLVTRRAAERAMFEGGDWKTAII